MTSSLFKELKRRQVFKVGAAYALVAWLTVQAASIAFPAFDAPAWAMRLYILVALLGFPVALVMAWVLERTPEGVQLDPVRKGTKRMVALAIVLSALAIGWYLRKNEPAFRADIASSEARMQALARTSVTPVAREISDQSIAVLPFENLSADPDNAFFATGIQDEILTSLAKVGGLKVISRTSTIKYGAKPDNLQQIGKELGVAYILEGSVQRSGDTVRVNVQLIDARSDQHRWAETYDRPLANVFAVQSEIAKTIAQELNTKLTTAEQAALAKAPTDNAEAYEHYLRGLAITVQAPSYARESSDDAIREFEAALKLDPRFAQAWSYLAFHDTWYYFTGFDPTKQRLDKALEDVKRAEALDPSLPQVRLARAWYQYYGLRDFKGALAITRALTRDVPNDQRGWYITGLLSRRLGDIDGAVAAFRRARVLGPNDYSAISELGVTLAFWHRYTQALPAVDAALDTQPGDPAMLGVRLHCVWNTAGLAAGAQMLAGVTQESAAVFGMRALQAEYERDDVRATALYERAIGAFKSDDYSPMFFSGYAPLTLEWRLRLAMIEQRRGDAAGKARAAVRYNVVIAWADQQLRETHNPYVQAVWHAARGMALAGLGRKAEAVAAGKRAVALAPASKDMFEGSVWPGYLARIHAMNGEGPEAAALLREAFTGRVGLETPVVAGLDPVFDPIRNDAQFRALISAK